jgi:hypothetical protein
LGTRRFFDILKNRCGCADSRLATASSSEGPICRFGVDAIIATARYFVVFAVFDAAWLKRPENKGFARLWTAFEKVFRTKGLWGFFEN